LFLEGSYEKLLNESISQLSKKSKDDIAFYFMSLALVKQNKSKAILQFLIELLFKIKDRQLIIIGLELVIANYLERKRVEEAAYFIDIYGKINPKSFRLINMYRDLEKINLHSKNLHNKKTK